MRSSWLLAFVLVTSAACTDEDSVETDDIEAPDDDGKADAATELRVRASDTTLWVDRALERRGDLFVLHGRTSRNIEDGRAFVFDDIYGDFVHETPRTFEVSWPVSTARGVVDGVNLFTSFDFAHSSSRPDHLTARAIVRPRLHTIKTTGPSGLALTAELTPVTVGGRIVYRVKGRSTKTISFIESNIGTTRLVDPTHFELDLDFDQIVSLGGPGQLSWRVNLPAGAATISAAVGLSVKRLGLTAGDVEVIFPVPSCTAPIKSCLLSLPDGALDLASCGEALKVQACRNEVGVTVDVATLDALRATTETQLAGSFAADAPALVGADHAAEMTAALRTRISDRLANQQNLWLVSATARATVLKSVVDGTFDDAYAFPLQLAPLHAPAPGDLAKTRQVTADALLAYLATQDYLHSEFGRSYLELARVFRTWHVASLRAFRETVVPQSFPSVPNTDYYTADWIGTYTEMTVDRTTGVVTNVLVEID